MVAIKSGSDADAALRRLDPRIAVVLIYGPDSGLVAERARRLAEATVTDASDPFQLVKLDGDGVASDPARLADEAGTIGLFGGKRAIWVRPTSKNLTAALESVLAAPGEDALVVIEAGDLNKTSPLRTLCEKSPRALAVPCYGDSDADIGTVIDNSFRNAGLSATREVRAILIDSLGADRLATRGEIDKLILYCHGRTEVTGDDLDAVLSDVSGLAVDQVVDAAFSGGTADADRAYRRLLQEGSHPSVILGALLRHAMALLPLRSEVETGTPPGIALQAWRGLHFKRKRAVEGHLSAWRGDALLRQIERIQSAILETRRTPEMADAVASRTIIDIALANRPRTGSRVG